MTSDNVISEIKLSLSHPEVKYYFLVEGELDVKFVKRVISDSILISESPGGKTKLIEIFKNINNERLIPICDRDYSACENGVVYYDYCSLESMLFSIKPLRTDFFDSLNIKYDNEKINNILDLCAYIGSIRKFNYENQYCINFNALSPSNYCDIDVERTHNNIVSTLNKSSTTKFNDYDVLFEYENEIEMLNLTQGHDLIALVKYIFNINKTSNDLEDRLVLASTPNLIRKTDFYKKITTLVSKNYLKDI